MAKPQPDREADVPVQRLRVRYAKRGRLRFVSHRDFQRALERALRRAAVPVAFSGGFSPHPRISYAGAAPTGAASEAEYFEVAVTERVDPERIRRDLDTSLPDGLDAVAVVEAPPGTPGLADLLVASRWRLVLPGVGEPELAAAVETFLAAETVEVERMTKKGLRRFDARAAVVRGVVRSAPARSGDGPGALCAILDLVVRHGTPAVRPDDVLTGLRDLTGLQLPSPAEVTRLTQGPWDDETGEMLDPFAPTTGAPRGT